MFQDVREWLNEVKKIDESGEHIQGRDQCEQDARKEHDAEGCDALMTGEDDAAQPAYGGKRRKGHRPAHRVG